MFIHRGGNDRRLFAEAADLGYQTFEGDVMLARDGAVMVHPGPDLPRRTKAGHLDYTVAEVQAIKRNGPGALEVPTLQEILGMVAEVDGHLLLESKIHGTMLQIVLGLVPNHERITIISFNGRELEFAHQAGFRCGLLMKHDPSHLAIQQLRKAYAFDIFLPHEWHISPETVGICHELSIEVVAWTVNSWQRARELAAMGVDAIETDTPAIVDELNEPTIEIG